MIIIGKIMLCRVKILQFFKLFKHFLLNFTKKKGMVEKEDLLTHVLGCSELKPLRCKTLVFNL